MRKRGQVGHMAYGRELRTRERSEGQRLPRIVATVKEHCVLEQHCEDYMATEDKKEQHESRSFLSLLKKEAATGKLKRSKSWPHVSHLTHRTSHTSTPLPTPILSHTHTKSTHTLPHTHTSTYTIPNICTLGIFHIPHPTS